MSMRRPLSKLRFLQRTVLPLALLATAAAAHAGASPGWDEAVNGDFSNDGLAPSFVVLGAGTNTIWGNTGVAVAGGPVDRDYFTISVPAGYVLESMLVLEGTMSIGSGSFLGLVGGNQFTVSPTTPTAAGLLGWTLFDEGNVGGDLLLFMSSPSFGSTGFATPLPAGDYSFWVQETGLGSARYGFAMAVTAVPEPATAASLLAGLGLLAAAMKRRPARV